MAVTEYAVPLREIARCFEAVIPGTLATCSADGVPNVISLSDVRLVDDRHVAASRQFFRKTHANLAANPRAQLVVTDPYTQEAFRLAVRFDHEETSGPLFDAMGARIAAIASMSKTTSVFHLAASVVFEVLAVERVRGALRADLPAGTAHEPPLTVIDAMTQLRVLRRISDCLRGTDDAETLLDSVLAVLDEALGFTHSMILLVDETGERLFAIASRGYGESGVGAEVRVGDGFIGTVAQSRRLMRVSSLEYARQYGRAVRRAVDGTPADEIPLPGLPDAASQLAIPLVVKDELLGVLAVESRSWLAYGERDEAFLDVVAGHIALGLRSAIHAEASDAEPAPKPPAAPALRPAQPDVTRRFVFYPKDDCVFVDGQYLIRNVPGRILWKLLTAHANEGRTEFTNRELRLDATLGMPALRDNLESRLILLRKRLAERCPDVRIASTGRGRFCVEARCAIVLDVRE